MPISIIFQLYRSWRSFLLVEETGVPAENYRPVASQWQTLSQNVVSSTPRHEPELKSLVITYRRLCINDKTTDMVNFRIYCRMFTYCFI